MTTLEKELKKRNVSLYRVALILGKSPQNSSYNIKNKITGKGPVSMDELQKICKGVSDFTGKPLTLEDLNYKADKVILK